jgi:hypothetical protein
MFPALNLIISLQLSIGHGSASANPTRRELVLWLSVLDGPETRLQMRSFRKRVAHKSKAKAHANKLGVRHNRTINDIAVLRSPEQSQQRRQMLYRRESIETGHSMQVATTRPPVKRSCTVSVLPRNARASSFLVAQSPVNTPIAST